LFVVGIIEGFEIFEGGVVGVGAADVVGYGDEFLFFGEGGDDELCYLRDTGGAADDVDGFVFEELRAEALGHASDDGDYEIGAGLLRVLEVTQVGEDPLFGVVADGAGVDDINIGGMAEWHGLEPRPLHRLTNLLGLVLVDLTTDSK
jgi:hypothetical protein